MPWPLGIAVFLSGASSLAFEVALQRAFVLTFGAATRASAATLAAYMAGLMLGGPLGGRLARGVRRPATRSRAARSSLARYAAVEAAAAVLALACLLAQPAVRTAYATWAADADGVVLGLLRLGLAFASVLPATLLGAAALPLALAALPDPPEGTARRRADAASLVATNVAGAGVGALFATFAGLRFAGLTGTAICAAALGLAAATVAVTALRARTPAGAPAPTPVETATPVPSGVLFTAGASGFVTLSLEVVLLRVAAVHTTAGVYAFGLVLVAALAGLALGGWFAARRLSRAPDGAAALLVQSVGAGGAVGLATVTLGPLLAGVLVGDPNALFQTSAAGLFLREASLAAALLLPAFAIQGAAFPAAVASVDARPPAVGRLLLVNLAGAALGALVTGWITLPYGGLRGAAGLAGLVGVGAAYAASPARPARPVVRAFLVGAACVAMAAVPVRHLKEADGDPVAFYKEGSDAVITVREGPRGRVLRVDGQTVASSFGGALTDAKMLGHLPLLLHPQPERALTVGFGSGGTSRAMIAHRVEVDVVEIEPAVVAAAPLFTEVHQDVLVDPLLHVVFEDARNHLLRTRTRYDVIASDCTNLQYGHNGTLYSREYWSLVRQRLTPDGIAVAWMPLGGLGREDLRMLVASFAAELPHATVHYFTNAVTNFFLLLGAPQRLSIDLSDLAGRTDNPGVAGDLASIGLEDPYRVAASLLVGETGVRRLVRGARLHTDDFPRLDYRTPYRFFRRTAGQRLADLVAVSAGAEAHLVGGDPGVRLRHVIAARLLARGNAALLSGRAIEAQDRYRAAEKMLPYDPALPVLLEEANAAAPIRP